MSILASSKWPNCVRSSIKRRTDCHCLCWARNLAVLASLGLGYWLSDQTLKPIEALTEAADNIVTARIWNVVELGRADGRTGRLTVVFNRMMDRLEHLFTAQRRLVADVSHELRTPLMAYSWQPRSGEALRHG